MHQHSPTRLRLLTLLLPLLGLLPAMAQNQKFSIESFDRDVTDLTASKGSTAARVDGNGDLYAIIKVTSNNPDDDLREYNFNFMSLNHIIDGIHDGELWIYVQKNAKSITITRDGYSPIVRHDLGEALSPGKVYRMQLASTARPVYMQIVQFKVQPPDCQATIIVQSTAEGSSPRNLGFVDGDGELSVPLPYGRYSYTVTAKDYAVVPGVFTLNDRQNTCVENIRLKPEFAMVTVDAPSGAEIVINGENKGPGPWSGRLPYGTHSVEARQANHRPASQNLRIDSPNPQTVELTPIPIMGSIAIVSSPSGAAITIDGQDYGVTPRNIDAVIGKHTVGIAKAGYQTAAQNVEVLENETSIVNLTLDPIKGHDNSAASSPVADSPKPAVVKKDKLKDKPKDKPKDNTQTTQDYFKRSGTYIQAAIGAGTMMNANGAIGAYIGGFNIEIGGAMGLSPATFYILYPSSGEYKSAKLTPMALTAKIGYGIAVGKRMRITPQVGVMALSAKDSDLIKMSAVSATVGAKVEYALARSLSIFVTPQGRFAVQKGDAFAQSSDAVSSIKGWGTGADVNIGISLNF